MRTCAALSRTLRKAVRAWLWASTSPAWGVFYADGNEPHKVLDYFAGHKFQDLTKLVIPKVGLFELGEFIDFLKSNLKSKKLEELQIPLIITATDLDHGRLVHFLSLIHI